MSTGEAAMLSPDLLVRLIRSSLVALAHANETGNYTVLRDLAAPGFSSANTAATLAQSFAGLRASGADVLAVTVLTPQLRAAPQRTPQGMLTLSGHLPTEPVPLTFDLIYQSVQGRWRLFGLSVQPGAIPQAAVPTAASPTVGDAAKKPPKADAKKR